MSRTLKVLADLAAVQVIRRFGSKPLLGFLLLALPFGLLGILTLGWAVWDRLIPGGAAFSIVKGSLALLFLATAYFLVLLGGIGELARSARHTSFKSGSRLLFEEPGTGFYGGTAIDRGASS